MGPVGSSGQTLNSLSIFKSIKCKISCKNQCIMYENTFFCTY